MNLQETPEEVSEFLSKGEMVKANIETVNPGFNKLMAEVRNVPMVSLDTPSSNPFRPPLKQKKGSFEDIKEYFLADRKRGLTVIPDGMGRYLKVNHVNFFNRIHEQFKDNTDGNNPASKNGLAYGGWSLASSLNLKNVLECPVEVVIDVVFLSSRSPLILLSYTRCSQNEINLLKYNQSLAKAIARTLRDFTNQRFDILFGVVDDSDVMSTDAFLKKVERIKIKTGAFSNPENLSMSDRKCDILAKALLQTAASTYIPNITENVKSECLWLLTKEQFIILANNIDKDKVDIHCVPGSGATVLMTEVAVRLQRSAKTLLICNSSDLKEHLLKAKICTIVMTRNEFIQERMMCSVALADVVNIVVEAESDAVMLEEVLRAKIKGKLWISHKVQGSNKVTEERKYTKREINCPNRRKSFKALCDQTVQEIQLFTKGTIKTRSCQKVIFHLEHGSPWVTLTGCPGEGKTTIGYQVLQHFYEKEFTPISVKSPDEFQTLDFASTKTVYLFNDFLGAFTYDPIKLDRWLAIFETAQRYTRNNVYFIFVTRLHIFNEALPFLEKFKYNLFKKETRIHLDPSALSKNERMSILKEHLNRRTHEVPNEVIDAIVSLDTIYGFPHHCQLFAEDKKAQRNPLGYFANPSQFLSTNIEILYQDKSKEELFLQMIKADNALCLDTVKSKEIHKASKELDGTIVHVNNGIVSFNHPSVFKAVARCIGRHSPKDLIQFSSLSSLCYFSHVSMPHEEVSYNEEKIVLPADCMEILSERFARELMAKNLAYVCRHPVCTEIFFLEKMFGCLQKHENENVVHQIDKTEGHSLLYWSTSSSSDTLCKYIIDSHEMNADELFDGLYGCCTWGNATALKLLMPLAESRCKSQNKSIETFINKRIIDGKTLLIQASCRGDTRTVDYLSKFHAHHKLVQIPDTIFGGNALHWSSAKGNESVVKALLELDSNVNSTNEFGLSALYLASQNGHAEVAFVLITNGADVNAQIESHQFTLDDEPYGPSYNRRLHPDKGYTPLHAACEEGHKDVVKLLLHFGAKKDLLSATGKSPLHAAACDGRHEAMECLLAAGDDVNRKWLEATPFDAAFACGQGSVIDVLLKREKGNNDFHILASTGNIGEIVSSNKININVQTRDKYTALHLAAFKGHQDVVEQLVQLGADCNSTSSFGFTPIFGSAISGFYGITKLLLDQGANARHQDIQGDNIVHYSSYHGHEDIVKILIEAGASVNQKGLFERTPLAWACLKGNYKVIKILLENGANENETDSEGWTALHVSAFFGYAEVVHILLQAGADPNSSGPGFTPLHAVSLGQIDNVRTPLQFAACAHLPSNDFAKGHIAIVSDLLECEANVNALNENEDIPLHIACKRGSHEMVKLLLSGKSETNKMNKDRKTPKDIAESKEYYDIVKLIDNFQK